MPTHTGDSHQPYRVYRSKCQSHSDSKALPGPVSQDGATRLLGHLCIPTCTATTLILLSYTWELVSWTEGTGLTGYASLQPAWGHDGGPSPPKACLVCLFSLKHQHPEGKGGLPSTPLPAKESLTSLGATPRKQIHSWATPPPWCLVGSPRVAGPL